MDSTVWNDFQFREDDVVVATYAKSGTTWTQRIVGQIPLPEQEWLLLGTFVDQVVPCRDGTPARIVAPDPRWFALHKLWLAGQARRNPLKRPKDRKQGMALLNTVAEAMPRYPLDGSFAAAIPSALVPMWHEWENQRRAMQPERW